LGPSLFLGWYEAGIDLNIPSIETGIKADTRAGVVSGLSHLTSSLQNSELKNNTSSTLSLLFSQPKKRLSFERAWHILIKEPTID
jgi:hypothetical protein